MAVTAGMTPAEFITEVNSIFNTALGGTQTDITDVMTGAELLSTLNDNYDLFLGLHSSSSLSTIAFGLSGAEYISRLNANSNTLLTTYPYLVNYWYGVSGLEASSPDLTRIGYDMTLHASLPIQSNMKGCILNDNGTVNYYLKATDWSKKADDSASDLTGADGQVMVEIPEHWYLDWHDGTVQKSAISTVAETGYNHIPKFYISAYEAAVNNTNSKLSSVKNLTADYRGGNNNDDWDLEDRTLLGKCATAIAMHHYTTPGTDFHTYAENRGALWNMHTIKARNVLARLFWIEYATKNAQKAYDGTLTAEGYKKGGLGNGVTNTDYTKLETFFETAQYLPFVPCGASDSLANASGEADYEIPFTVPQTVKVCRYRGIENIWGHMWQFLDGVVAYSNTDTNMMDYYVWDDRDDFAPFTIANARLVSSLPMSTNGVLVSIVNNDLLPLSLTPYSNISGIFSTYFCDGVTPGHLFINGNHFNHFRHGGYAVRFDPVAEADNSSFQGLLTQKSDDWQGMGVNYCGTRLTCYPNGY